MVKLLEDVLSSETKEEEQPKLQMSESDAEKIADDICDCVCQELQERNVYVDLDSAEFSLNGDRIELDNADMDEDRILVMVHAEVMRVLENFTKKD